MQCRRLENKICAITGGNRGIGLGIVEKFLEEGAYVAFCGTRPDAVRETAERLGILDRIMADVVDVSDEAEIRAWLERVEARWGGLDVLVNNAGRAQTAPLDGITRKIFEWHMAINTWSVVAGTQAAAAIMRKRSYGKIINTLSISAINSVPGNGTYSASKAAARAYTLAFARELACEGIRVNAICPGIIRTPIWDDSNYAGLSGERLMDHFVDFLSVPLGKAGEVSDIAELAVYLASPASDYMTGQILIVDGGASQV